MKKSELIAKLSEIKGDPDVVIIDLAKNFSRADENGSSNGIYSSFDVESLRFIENKGNPNFIGLTYEPKTL